ncbi:hypothetical protein QLQ80_01220 [Mycoplasma sp. M5725]|uniref:Lipoprotein n=1 Tax=Mycoplasma phocimorsus TaxID=3045839 RepID=A0AAJ1PQX8_9MOLU|nr:hypothetical protein [Mycoplasma phocimorsus]MDJ1645709.1 hypothetical protein [Mycoplasma phocimorsus]
MRKNKFFIILNITLNITTISLLIACKNNEEINSIAINFNKQKEILNLNKQKNQFLPLQEIDINNSSQLLQKNEKFFNINLNSNKNIIIEKNVNKKDVSNSNNKQNKVSANNKESALLEQLIKQEKQNKKSEEKHKVIVISFVIASSVITGVVAGISAYFGYKNINSLENQKKKDLEVKIAYYKKLFEEWKPSEPLINVLHKLFELSFSEYLPKAIFSILKEVLLKDLLQDFTSESEDLLISKLQKIEKPSKEILNEFNKKLIDINLSKKDAISKVSSEFKSWIVSVVKDYLPKAFRGILNFISTQSTEGAKGSILSRFLEKILLKWNIKLNNFDSFSKTLSIYTSLFIDEKNEFINFVIDGISKAINKADITFNILEDTYKIINSTIEELIAEDKKISVTKIFNDVLPKINSIVNIDKNVDYSSYIDFINSIFSEEKNGNNNWVYSYILTGKLFDKEKTNSLKNDKSNSPEIVLPSFDINFDNVWTTIKNRDKIFDTVKNLMYLIFEPFVIELEKGKNQENTKRAIFRISALLSFTYYNFVKVSKINLINSIFHSVNPIEPITCIPKIIKELLEKYNITNITLDVIFGKTYNKYYITGQRYKIFEITEQAAKNHNNNLINILKNGNNK